MLPHSGSAAGPRWALTLLPVAIALVLVAGLGFYYSREQEAVENGVDAELGAIVEGKVTQIANWRRERLGDGRVQVASLNQELFRRLLLSNSIPAADRNRFQAVAEQLERQFLYAGAFLVTKAGRVAAQYPAGRPLPARFTEFAREGAEAADVRLEDLYLDEPSSRPVMALTIPVAGAGALILEIDPNRFLYPLLESWPGPTQTGEMYLVRRFDGNGVEYLSRLRYRQDAPLVFRRNVNLVPSDAMLEKGWQMHAPDYRGVMVLGAARHVPESSWIVLVKMDAAEAKRSIRLLEAQMGVGLALIAVVTLACLGLLRRDRELRMQHERDRWFQTVANETPAYLWMIFAHDRRVFMNLPLREYLGVSGDAEWASLAGYLHSEDVARERTRFLRRLSVRGEYASEFRLRRCDGVYRWVENRGLPRFGPAGEFLGYAGSVAEIDGRVKAERQLRSSNAALAHEVAERTRHEEEIRSLSARLMNAQEEERSRLARELHDDLSQQIAALSLATANVERRISPQTEDVKNELGRLQTKLSNAAETIRHMSHQLHPAVLEHAGLGPALHAYCEEFSELTGIEVEVETESDLEGVRPAVALSLYRIAQEALQNVAKHAQTGRALVRLRRQGGALRLTVSDSGVGMPGDGGSGGLGLVSIKERTRLIGGAVRIESAPNQGTSISVEVPEGSVARVE